MSVAVGAGWFGLGRMIGGRTADVLGVAILIPLAGAIYAGLLWWLKIEGREELQAFLAAKFGRSSRATS
jgi:putative peptidoglycan lipid II flippase